MQLPGTPFRVKTEDAQLDDLSRRLASSRWPVEPENAGWSFGTAQPYLRELIEYWRERFDWRQWETRINRFEQRLVDVEGQVIHVLIERGSGSNPMPLILTHGWPGSFLEFIDLIEPLAHPERFGGRVEDAFTVVVPSLPGYGYSPAPKVPMGPRQIARLWSKLATEHFGFDRYVAQGGDWGGVITGLLSRLYPQNLLAVHLNMLGNMPVLGADAGLSKEEGDWLARLAAKLQTESAYQQIQGTKPQSLAYGLTDSPVGLAAWIVEKFQGWTLGVSDQAPPFSMDWMIANLMLYWINGISGANWLYQAQRSGNESQVAEHERKTVPAGFSLFPNDLMLPPPKAFVERIFDVRYYRVFEQGGHFPALEQGELLTKEIREFFRRFR